MPLRQNANKEDILSEVKPISVDLGDGISGEVSSEFGTTTPKQIWESKDVWFEKAKKSREDYEAMSQDQKEALERLVTGALERMHDKVADWLPEGLTVEGGNFLDVNIRFLFTDIDKEIDRNETATSFQVKEALKRAQEAEAEFDDEDE